MVAQPQGTQKTLTMSQAVALALERNVMVRQAANNVERDQSNVTAAFGNFLPSASLSAGWSGGIGESNLPNGEKLPSTTSRSLSTSVGASATLFDGFSNTTTYDAAVANVQSTEYTFVQTRQIVVRETQKRFYEVLRTQRLLKVAEDQLKYSQQQLDRVKETARLGSASIVNVYQQQAQVGSDEVQLVQAQNNYELAKANLLAYIAVDFNENMLIQDPTIPEELSLDEMKQYESSLKGIQSLASEALTKRPDYQSTLQLNQAAELRVAGAKSGYLPRLTASLSYGYRGSYSSATPGAVNEFSDYGNSRSLSWNFNFSLPLFSGWQTDNAVQAAIISKKNAEESLRDNVRQIGVEIRTALLALESARKSYEASMKNLEYQDKNLKVNQERYNVGAGTMLDLLFADNNYKSALSTKINAIYQYLNAKGQLEYALGSTGN
jgi:outer membrane protein